MGLVEAYALTRPSFIKPHLAMSSGEAGTVDFLIIVSFLNKRQNRSLYSAKINIVIFFSGASIIRMRLHDPPVHAAVIKESDDESLTVGHIPREISRLCWYFLNNDGKITYEVTGNRRHSPLIQGGLEILCNYFKTLKKTSQNYYLIVLKFS